MVRRREKLAHTGTVHMRVRPLDVITRRRHHDRAGMTRHRKLLRRLLDGRSDQAIRFEELCTLLRRLGFGERRPGGSHRIFVRGDVAEILNLQPRSDGTAKPYQLRQVRDVIVRYGLDRLTTGRVSDELDDP